MRKLAIFVCLLAAVAVGDSQTEDLSAVIRAYQERVNGTVVVAR